MRLQLAAIIVIPACVALLATSPVCASPKDEIKATFGKFVAAQNAHDLKAVGALLSNSPDFLWITPDNIARGRDAAIKRFGELFQSNWRVDPDWSTFQILMLDASTGEIFVRVSTTIGASAQSARMNQVLVNTARGWRVFSILHADQSGKAIPLAQRGTPTGGPSARPVGPVN
jgi:ketosteroid isomerase-like protein